MTPLLPLLLAACLTGVPDARSEDAGSFDGQEAAADAAKAQDGSQGGEDASRKNMELYKKMAAKLGETAYSSKYAIAGLSELCNTSKGPKDCKAIVSNLVKEWKSFEEMDKAAVLKKGDINPEFWKQQGMRQTLLERFNSIQRGIKSATQAFGQDENSCTKPDDAMVEKLKCALCSVRNEDEPEEKDAPKAGDPADEGAPF